MEGASEEEQDEENAIVKGEDAEGAAGVKIFEEVRQMQGVLQDAGDEETGEGKEEIDSDIGGGAELA